MESDLKKVGQLARKQGQGKNPVQELVFDPITGTFIEKRPDEIVDTDTVATVMTQEGFA